MARKPPHAPQLPAPQDDAESEIVLDGDYAGLRSADVLRALADGIHSLFDGTGPENALVPVGGVDLATAGASLDLALGEYLSMVQVSIGDNNAKVAALAFCETIIPFASLPVPVTTAYSDARKLRGHRK